MNDPVSIAVDPELCVASAMCQSIAPMLFATHDDADTATVPRSPVSERRDIALAEEAAHYCPTQAILLHRAGAEE
jgi:ferredoxin